ncbi:MAG: STAS domain-containing protein [Myxococcota bacterium]
MADGDILYATHDGLCILKLIGDIRYTTGPAAVISRSLNIFLDNLFEHEEFDHVLVDMTETTAIDSTNLGVLARLVTYMQERDAERPTLLSTRPDITRTLESIGFDRVFTIIEEPRDLDHELERLPQVEGSQREMLEIVLDAHRRLMELNEDNREMFAPAVELLDAEMEDADSH